MAALPMLWGDSGKGQGLLALSEAASIRRVSEPAHRPEIEWNSRRGLGDCQGCGAVLWKSRRVPSRRHTPHIRTRKDR